jgi:hypothetical protein
MDFVGILSAVEIRVPIYMVICYLAVISVCVLLSRIKVGLALSFFFVFYVGYLHNRTLLVEAMKGSIIGIGIYASLGFVILIFAILSLFSSPK